MESQTAFLVLLVVDLAQTGRTFSPIVSSILSAGNLWINGRLCSGEAALSDVYNPRSGDLLCQVPDASTKQVDLAVKAAKDAFPNWSNTTPRVRSEALLALADLVGNNAEFFALAEALNCGKPQHLVLADEIPAIVDTFRFFAGAARSQYTPAAGDYTDGATSFMRLAPVGVIGAIAPWNYPLMMAAWKIAPAIAAGCTIVLKPAEVTPVSALLLATLSETVLPPGVLNIVTGRGATVGKAISSHPAIDMVALTGDTATGSAILEAVAPRVARTHLELGGKSPVIVLDDANMSELVESLCAASFYNAGQDCTAASSILATPGAYAALTETFPGAVGRLMLNNDDDAKNALGPLITEAQRKKVAALVRDAIEHGARCLTGGKTGTGFYYEPTVLCDLPADARLTREEAFGPVVTITKVNSLEDAINRANSSGYGLAASVWTQDISAGLQASARLRYGCTWVNCHSLLVNEMPHGGLRQSGYGKDLSSYALSDYQVPQHIMLRHTAPSPLTNMEPSHE